MMNTLSKVIGSEQMQNIRNQFQRLEDRCYIENAGAAIYPQALVEKVNQDLIRSVYMNPHTDKYTKDCIEQARSLVLKYFNCDSSDYTVIFTSGTTSSLKLVVESFQFAKDDNDQLNCGSLVYLRDNHTSVLGLRPVAEERGADIVHISHDDFLEYIDPQADDITSPWKEKHKNEGNTLFVYPAQSNFNGYKYSIDCIQDIRNGCLNNYIKKSVGQVNTNWYVLLDAASFVSTSKLDLTATQPDFVGLSFYKIFGYPTGLGALLVKRSSEHLLSRKKYYGGGTVDLVLTSENYHIPREHFYERFEDGTHNFLSIVALKHCFDFLNNIIPKIINNDVMETISYHTFYLGKDLYQQLKSLRHPNGKQAAVLYMDSDFEDIKTQGGIVTFSILRMDGSYIGYSEFQHMADLFNINVRTGCFCNSGACQRHLKATNKEMKMMYRAGHKCGDEVDLLEGRPTGAVRASFGYYNTYKDVDTLMEMIFKCFVKGKVKIPNRSRYRFKNVDLPVENNIYDKTRIKYHDQDLLRRLETHHHVHKKSHDTNISTMEINVYPIKSCGVFKVDHSWKIGNKGLEYDRVWMIVKENNVCLSQKHNTQMVKIRPVIDYKKKMLVLHFKGQYPVAVPLDPQTRFKKEISVCHSKVCNDIIRGYDCGDEVADWLSAALGVSSLRLMRQATDDSRERRGRADHKPLLSLSNKAQYLLINRATVRWLQQRIEDPLFTDTIEELTDRFRGNIVIDSEDELIERNWQRILIGKHEFKVDGECTRCQMVCIDQKTGDKTVEPLRTISEQFGGKLRFGIYLTYIGPVDGSKDRIIKTHSPVKPIHSGEDVNR